MAAYNKFDCFTEDAFSKKHDFTTDQYKFVLSNVEPTADDEVLADITQIANGGGYTSGGYNLDNVTLVRTGGATKIVIDDEVITAVGGPMAEYRHVVIYNATTAGNPLVGWYSRGSGYIAEDGESLTIDFNQANGIFVFY